MMACLFDIDGTLLSSGGAGKHAMYAAIASEFAVAELNDGVAFAGRTDRAIGRDLFLTHGIADCDVNWERFVRSYLRHLPDSLRTKPGSVLPGVVGLLTELKRHSGIAIGLLTGNLRKGAHAKLTHYAIDSYFEFGGFGDLHLDRCDVACEAISALSRHIGAKISSEEVWVIGDTPLDVECARSIGARVLAVCTGFHGESELAACCPDLLVRDLSDTARVISALTPAR